MKENYLLNKGSLADGRLIAASSRPYHFERSEESRLAACPAQVGIDVGLTTFATPRNGETIDNLRFFQHEEKALAKVQRGIANRRRVAPPGKTTFFHAIRSLVAHAFRYRISTYPSVPCTRIR